MPPHLRIARPVTDLAATEAQYCAGLGLRVLGRFADHDGFDGVMLGVPDAGYHFEFTHCRRHPLVPAPTVEDLAVFYVPDEGAWRAACAQLATAGFATVASFNPYWDARGRTFADRDGYRVVLQNAGWANTALG